MKVELKVQDLLQKAANDKFYIALLRERDGNRSLPILVGLLEAQAIAMFLRDVSTERPMLHDLIAGMADAFAIRIQEVYIYKVKGGVFYSYLVCEQYGQTVNVDARTSDAIAIALHQGRPIYIDEELLNAQCMHDEGGGAYSMPITVMNTEVLRGVLKTAIEREDYELAAHLRDVIREREGDNSEL
ncbi:MAG: bifunctional nuclease family protein [Bacteroidaceae bacterium]|nr:bifunctional nuclease family protein [Bacteroidaceae bacterium]